LREVLRNWRCCCPHGLLRALTALPTLDIAEGALDRIFALYKELLPEMGGYLTHAGELHRGRLQARLESSLIFL
jgi:5'-3' exonuclease